MVHTSDWASQALRFVNTSTIIPELKPGHLFHWYQIIIQSEDKVYLILLAGSRIYHLRGFDPDDDPLKFGVRDQVGNEILRIENVGKNEADVFLKKELDREVM
jgi:hypothetical protein